MSESFAAAPASSMEAVPALAFLRGGGEMGALIRAFDWQASALGKPEAWTPALQIAISLLLRSHQPMYLWWGPQLLCFYNDAYRRSIGAERHPSSLARPGREVWAEIWDTIGPQIEEVLTTGESIMHDDALVPITRNGRREDVYWTYSYNPVIDPGAAHEVAGVLVICSETTDSVVAGRRDAAELRKLAELFEQAPIFMAMLDGPDHRFELINPSYRRLIGARDLIGHTVTEAVPESIGQGYVDLLDRVYHSGEPFTATGMKLAIDDPGAGTIERYLDFVYQPIKDKAGRVTGIFVVGVDATERNDADAALRNSEEQLRLATEAAEVGLWDVDVGSDILYWPPRVKAMFGISAERPVSMSEDFFPCLHPADRERVTAALAAALDPTRKALYDVEYRTIGKEDGVLRWVAAKGRGLFDGDRCTRVIGTAIDITARKAAEAELEELNERLEHRVAVALAEKKVFVDIIESTDARVQVLDLDFRIMAINKATADDIEHSYGVRPKVGDNLLQLLDSQPEHRDQVKRFWSRALAGEEFSAIDEFGDLALERRYYELKFNSLRDPYGHLIGAFQFVYDVTERIRDQARLSEAESQLRQSQKSEALGQLTGGVAHDFNNLLMIIKGGISLLKRPQLESERRQRLLAGMEQAADRGATLSRQLLTFARRQPLKAESVDLRQQTEGMRELLNRTLRGDVQVKTDFPKNLWPVEVDPAELEFVILNLCVNARDAMPSGGDITIRARNAPDVRQGKLSGHFVALTVTDTGTGMSPEVLEHVFEPFYTTKEIGKGSGLGLPQVQGFAEQSGGAVKIATEVGRGTTVTLLLPRSETPAAAQTAVIDLDNTGVRRSLRGSLLLVEDDDEVAALVTDMLQELGYRVTRVASAKAALGALADDRAIDIVFSDVMMPGDMNGAELAREVRRRRAGLPVLLTTGYASGALSQSDDQDVEVLHKPYEIQALDAALRAARRRGKKND